MQPVKVQQRASGGCWTRPPSTAWPSSLPCSPTCPPPPSGASTPSSPQFSPVDIRDGQDTHAVRHTPLSPTHRKIKEDTRQTTRWSAPPDERPGPARPGLLGLPRVDGGRDGQARTSPLRSFTSTRPVIPEPERPPEAVIPQVAGCCSGLVIWLPGIPHGAVNRWLRVCAADQLMHIYSSVTEAVDG